MNSLDPFLESFCYRSDERWQIFDLLQPLDIDISSRAGTPAATESAALVELPEENGATDPSNEQTQLSPDKLPCYSSLVGIEKNYMMKSHPAVSIIRLSGKSLNNQGVSKDTEQDLVLAPASYCQLFLQPKLAKLLRKKVFHNKCVRSDATNITVSVTKRS